MKKISGYLFSALALFIFQLVYHHFGHGVTAQSLQLVWVIPMAGLLIWLILRSLFRQRASRLTYNLLNSSLAALGFWASINGILEIAGSDSPYLIVYLITAGLMAGATLISLFLPQKSLEKPKNSSTC